MKIDFLKLGNYLRLGASALFSILAIIGFIGIVLGNYLHLITMTGSIAMAYTIAKYW